MLELRKAGRSSIRLIESISYNDTKEYNSFVLSKMSIRDELIKIYKDLYMEEECSIRGLLDWAEEGVWAKKNGAKKKTKMKTMHIFLLNGLIINNWRSWHGVW